MSDSVEILVTRLPHAEGLPLPSYATAGAAGMDLMAAVSAPLVIPPGGRVLVPTGLRIALPAGHELQVRPRSGLALKNGITLPNSPGTIDEDYRGELGVILGLLHRFSFPQRWPCNSHVSAPRDADAAAMGSNRADPVEVSESAAPTAGCVLASAPGVAGESLTTDPGADDAIRIRGHRPTGPAKDLPPAMPARGDDPGPRRDVVMAFLADPGEFVGTAHWTPPRMRCPCRVSRSS